MDPNGTAVLPDDDAYLSEHGDSKAAGLAAVVATLAMV